MMRRRRRPGTLGDSWLATANPILPFGDKLAQWIADKIAAEFSPPAPPPQFIPGSSTSDYLLNAATGQPTQSQLNYNAQQYIQAAANMRQTLLAQGVTPPIETDPAIAAAQAYSDQRAYANLIGGTAEQNAPLSITTWAVIAIAATIGIIVVTR